jgi:hypothetical protein
MIQPVNHNEDVAALSEKWCPAEEPDKSDTGKIRSIADLVSFPEHVKPITYIEQPVLVEASVTALTGDAECGKSTLACAWAKRSGRKALLLDRENSMWGIGDRFDRLGIRKNDPAFKVWAGWQPEQAPIPFSPIIVEWVQSCDRPPIVIIDSLSGFYNGSQNDAEAMRAFMHQCRRLADLNAAVIVIHHDGKAETAKDYRGSTDFKAAIDAGYHVTNASETRRLHRIALRCFKSRFGLTETVAYLYNDGALTREQDYCVPNVSERLRDLLRENPGITKSAFRKLAADKNLGRNRADKWVETNKASRHIRSSGNRLFSAHDSEPDLDWRH